MTVETVTKTIATNLQPGSRYAVRIRTINSLGVPSDWSEALSFNATTDTVAPSAVSNLTGISTGETIYLQWDKSTDVDISYYEVFVRQGSSDFTPGVSEKPAAKYAGTSTTGFVLFYWKTTGTPGLTTILPPNDYKVKMRAVDVSGNASPFTSITVTHTGLYHAAEIEFPFYNGSPAATVTAPHTDTVFTGGGTPTHRFRIYGAQDTVDGFTNPPYLELLMQPLQQSAMLSTGLTGAGAAYVEVFNGTASNAIYTGGSSFYYNNNPVMLPFEMDLVRGNGSAQALTSTTPVTITGLSQTITGNAGDVIILILTLDIQKDAGATTNTCVGYVYVGSSPVAGNLIYRNDTAAASAARVTVSQCFYYELPSTGSFTFTGRAALSAGTAGYTILGNPHSTLLLQRYLTYIGS